MRWSLFVLIVLLFADVWYRAHTFGPTIAAATGVRLWPTCTGPTEPLDCDEAAYAYIGHRIINGDVMYRDLTENKPPLGYWYYALAVAAGGYNELTIRLLAIPAVLLTIALVWWIGLKLSGPLAACLAALIFVILSTDPYLFGNGSNLEHLMNLFSVASLALMILGWNSGRRWPVFAAGFSLGAAALVKQVAILPLAVYVGGLILRRRTEQGVECPSRKSRSADIFGFGLGLALIVGLVCAVLIVQGAKSAAYADIIQYGTALATDTLPEPNAPSGLVRWLTGNADPSGKLPWPFGVTNYLVWWGTGSWPLWLAAVPAVAYLLFGGGQSETRRLVAAWTITLAVEVVLPGLYWQHYYLLPTPGIALVVAVALADCLGGWTVPDAIAKSRLHRRAGRFVVRITSTALLILALCGTAVIQARAYLLVPPQELTVRHKGGGQWVVLRTLGQELARRARLWTDARLYVWGWQSPLHFYSGIDGVTRHFFVDNLLRDQAEREHPLIKPRIAEIMRALRERSPALIFAGYPPFPELTSFLRAGYRPSSLVPTRNGLGLWVKRERFAAFEDYPASSEPSRSWRRDGLDTR
jgi:4-amino-4-deoxy-L-arabinose transferase-like glycosyltransferase